MSMRHIVKAALGAAFLVASFSFGVENSGELQLPYNENQVWSNGSVGWAEYGNPYSHQYHMELNSNIGKYHAGEDVNGIAGGNTDMGAPLFSIGEGEVSYVHDEVSYSKPSKGRRVYIKYSIPYAFGDNGVLEFDSALFHLGEIDSSVYTSGRITKGQKIAYLGNSGTDFAHIHWELHKYKDGKRMFGYEENSYRQTLTIDKALQLLPPSMVVDDRKIVKKYSINKTSWNIFTMEGNATWATVYVERNGMRKCIDQAIDEGWIWSYGIIYENGANWYYASDNSWSFMWSGKRYGIKALVDNVSLCIPIPGNNFRDDRARRDMTISAKEDERFWSVKTEIYSFNKDWNQNFSLRIMGFGLRSGGVGYIAHATYKTNPLIRYTIIHDPDTRSWTSWRRVNFNQDY